MKTHVTFVLDSSGSMSKIEDDTTGGFNSFLTDQRDGVGTATVSLYEFDSAVELVYEGRPVSAAPELSSENYSPGGQTALHDAIVTAITGTEDVIGSMSPTSIPDAVVVVVLTDGKENASETPQQRVREVVERKQKDDWEFLFVGANQDAALTASSMGMDKDRSLNMSHSGDGARAAYESTSNQISEARSEGTTSGYHDSDRRRQDDADDS
ncbi:vWA domain-containing protein [Haloarchaeobius litoreus]|uniref:VWA domain-containing protein n=1 Tax=Haloarchaeobius litoreus TaxID=755306 RepID=A0ABD6DNH6_9EURY|nr:vWA domain-containing protein [Haloarchaeobius litoreus]